MIKISIEGNSAILVAPNVLGQTTRTTSLFSFMNKRLHFPGNNSAVSRVSRSEQMAHVISLTFAPAVSPVGTCIPT